MNILTTKDERQITNYLRALWNIPELRVSDRGFVNVLNISGTLLGLYKIGSHRLKVKGQNVYRF